MPHLTTRLYVLLAMAPFAAPCFAGDSATPGLTDQKPADGPYVETDQGYMVPYVQEIPGTGVSFKMTPIAGGVVTLGPRAESDDAEAEDAEPDAYSPSQQVRIAPYWMATHEVTWAEYRPFMSLNATFSDLAFLRSQLYEGSPKLEKAIAAQPVLQAAIDAAPQEVDAITAPTALYDPSTTYYSGEAPNLPAVTMTVYAARQYTKWLSILTGTGYRLPSEAEWEHAARAGDKGDAPAEPIDEIAWYEANSDYEAHPVGEKAPNAAGLYDMIGNAAEWVLDAPVGQREGAQEPLSWRDAIGRPEKQHPRIAKGGFYETEPEDATFAARMLSVDEDWKASDPNVPLSPWWFADDPAMGVGFRVVRPLEPMSDEVKQLAWEVDSPDLARDVKQRVQEGRGKQQAVDASLPKVIEQLQAPEIRKLME